MELTEDEAREVEILLHNRCKCSLCEDIIESKHRHDYISCGCGSIFTDGGLTYVRRGGVDLDYIIDMSVYRRMTKAEVWADLKRLRVSIKEMPYMKAYYITKIKAYQKLLFKYRSGILV